MNEVFGLLFVVIVATMLMVACKNGNSAASAPNISPTFRAEIKDLHRGDLIRMKYGKVYFVRKRKGESTAEQVQLMDQVENSIPIYWQIRGLAENDAHIIRQGDMEYEDALRQFVNQTQ